MRESLRTRIKRVLLEPPSLKTRIIVGVIGVILLCALFIPNPIVHKSYAVPDYDIEDSFWISTVELENGQVDKTIIEVCDHATKIYRYIPGWRKLYVKQWKTWKAYCGISKEGDEYFYKYDVKIQFVEDELIITHIDEETGEVLYNRTFTKHTITPQEELEFMSNPINYPVVE